jgi:hypothetical protein
MQPNAQPMPGPALPGAPHAMAAPAYLHAGIDYPSAGMAAGMTERALAARASAAQPALGLGSDRFVRGLLIGAAAAYLLTNEEVQRTVIKGAVKLWSTVQGGVEEAKERFRDAEAEIQAAAADKHP